MTKSIMAMEAEKAELARIILALDDSESFRQTYYHSERRPLFY